MLNTIAERIYSKHDIKNSVVFSEFLTFDFSRSKCGGINLI